MQVPLAHRWCSVGMAGFADHRHLFFLAGRGSTIHPGSFQRCLLGTGAPQVPGLDWFRSTPAHYTGLPQVRVQAFRHQEGGFDVAPPDIARHPSFQSCWLGIRSGRHGIADQARRRSWLRFHGLVAWAASSGVDGRSATGGLPSENPFGISPHGTDAPAGLDARLRAMEHHTGCRLHVRSLVP